MLPRSLLILALLYTALNCVKPLVIDDAAYYYYARQIADHPLDPYGHNILWYNYPEPANSILAPAVLPYYLAPSVWLFPQQPILWKLWLFPFGLLFIWSLHDLFRRFAPDWQVPMTWLTVLSPAFLPNMMLDVPALALSLTGVALFLRAIDRDSYTLAILAGLVIGVGMQTKYTAGVALPVMLTAALIWKKPRLILPAMVMAVQVFLTWELITALLYGESHFLTAMREGGRDASLWKKISDKLSLILPLFGNLGGCAAAMYVLMMAALGASRRLLLMTAGTLGLLWLIVLTAPPWLHKYYLGNFLFVMMGLCGAVVVVVGFVWLIRRPPRWPIPSFLVSWLFLETMAYYPLTPFPAVRRVMGIVVVLAMLAGHLASRTAEPNLLRRRWPWIFGFGVALGGLIYAVDLLEAWTERNAAEFGALKAREIAGPDHTVWYTGHWGFQHYGEAAGMKPIVTRYHPEASALKEGDTIVVPSSRVYSQVVYLDPDKVEVAPPQYEFNDPVPWNTVWAYYSGPAPMTFRGSESRLSLTIYRVKKNCFLDPRKPDD